MVASAEPSVHSRVRTRARGPGVVVGRDVRVGVPPPSPLTRRGAVPATTADQGYRPQVSRAIAFVLFALALIAAFATYRHTHTEPCGLGFDKPVCNVRDGWQEPLAVGIVAVGLLVAGVVGFVRRL